MLVNKTYEQIFQGEHFDFRTLGLEENFSNSNLEFWTFRMYFNCMEVYTLGSEESLCM